MTISRVKPSAWAVNDTLTSAQINAIDVTLTTALDKTVAGDTLSGVITLSGAGRVVPSVTLGSDANSTITVGGGNTVIRVTSAVTANRDYTLSATGAATNDVITLYAESSFAYSITVKDQASATMFTLGNTDTDDGPWCSFIYVGGWRKFQTSQGSRIRQVTYTSGSGTFTVPAGVTSLLLIGWGGGGGGGGGRTGTTIAADVPGGGGGGAGAQRLVKRITVTPGASYSYAVGAGGTAGVGGSVPTDGGAGGSTTFGALATFLGGNGGRARTSIADLDAVAKGGETGTASASATLAVGAPASVMSTASVGGYGGINGVTYSRSPADGGKSAEYAGGAGASNAAAFLGYNGGGGGGGGGAGPGGVGAAGGNGGGGPSEIAPVAGSAAAANSGAGGGGGGGSFCSSSSGSIVSGANGGAGGSGQLTVIWVK